VDRVIAAAAIDAVMATAGGDRVVPCAGPDAVIPGACIDDVGGVRIEGLIRKGSICRCGGRGGCIETTVRLMPGTRSLSDRYPTNVAPT
jgi:hypothetical protein